MHRFPCLLQGNGKNVSARTAIISGNTEHNCESRTDSLHNCELTIYKSIFIYKYTTYQFFVDLPGENVAIDTNSSPPLRLRNWEPCVPFLLFKSAAVQKFDEAGKKIDLKLGEKNFRPWPKFATV